VKRHATYGELQPLPLPKGPWQQLTMDFMSGVPPSKWNGKVYDALLVIIDRYTKMALYIPVTKKLTAAELADLLLDRVVARFGTLLGIVSDRDSRFTSAFWSDLCYFAKIKRRLSTAFHPQTDGQTERQNQTIQEYLRAFCSENQASWTQLLAVAEFAYNNSKHSSTGISPFMAMYSYNLEIRFDVEDDVQEERVPAAKERIETLYNLREKLADRWEKAVESQAKHYNKRHIPMKFNKGDLVLVSTRNLSLKTPSRKLAARSMGPFRVLEPVGSLAYLIQLPANCKIHPVFSVSLLEKYHSRAGEGEQPEILPPPEIIDGEEEWEVEEILDSKNKGKAKKYLVKWVGYPTDFNQWVPAADLANAPDMLKSYEEQADRRPNPGKTSQIELRRSQRHQGKGE
jgi:transposase InsO family protein